MDAPFSIGKLLVFSPHLDDAVLSCGELLACHPGATVATVFAATPAGFDRLTSWDAASGFASAREAVASRRKEDAHALSILGAQALWLDYYDSQYDATPALAQLTDGLHALVRRYGPGTILLPAGLFHSDHVLVHQALLAIRPQFDDIHWLMYEDALYRRIPGLLQQRLSTLAQGGVQATPIEVLPADSPLTTPANVRERKHQAVQCYASQLRALGSAANGYADAYTPERFWRLESASPDEAQKTR